MSRHIVGQKVQSRPLNVQIAALTAVERWLSTLYGPAMPAWQEAMADAPWSYGDAEYTLVPKTRFLGHLDVQMLGWEPALADLTEALDGVDYIDLEG